MRVITIAPRLQCTSRSVTSKRTRSRGSFAVRRGRARCAAGAGTGALRASPPWFTAMSRCGGPRCGSLRDAPDPPVHGITLVLPETGHDLVRDLDGAEPLDRLVAVHRRHVEADRPAVLGGDRAAEHAVGDDHVGQLRLVEGEALGVDA